MVFKQTSFDEYTVRKAGVSDYTSIVELLKAVAKSIQDKGINQWGYLLAGGEDLEIEADILAGDTYIIENKNDEIVATFNFSSRQNEWDFDMWGKRTDHAYYLHRLAVSVNHRHKQIGKRLMTWIDENHPIENGYIRLDCVANNTVLNQFYQDTGFQLVGVVGEGEDSFSLYEKLFFR